MKKSVFILLALLVCSFQTSKAYEYFTICFKDGTKSEAFYATDVDSICYSQIGLDSLEYIDWKVQEIYTCDSVYRYPLSEIDSLSFKDVDVNVVAEDIDRANSVIVPLYAQCESTEELSQHISTIRGVEGVEDAWTNAYSLFVKIRDWGVISFNYAPVFTETDCNFSPLQKKMLRRVNNIFENAHIHNYYNNACIYNHMANDENPGFEDSRRVVANLKGMYERMGISCDALSNLKPSFFRNQIFNYDLLFLITHGEYDGTNHWLLTDEELFSMEAPYGLVDGVVMSFAFDSLIKKYPLYSPNMIGIGVTFEIQDGKYCIKFYTKISDRFISSSSNHFNNNTIIFNAACQSLTDNDSLAKTFIKKGACCYIGYDNVVRVGRLGGQDFFESLLNGSCIYGSYEDIYAGYKSEVFYVNGIKYEPKIKMVVRENDYNNIGKICITHSETLKSDDVSQGGNIQMQLKGRIKKIDTPSISNYYSYGFQWSTNSDMSQAKEGKADASNYDNATLYMNWGKTLDNNILKSGTTYYYRAYMDDGYSKCYGEIMSFTTKDGLCPDNNHPHAIDLGLTSGTKWCCCNVGASKPEENGGYYAWGETSEKDAYIWDNYAYYQNDNWVYIGSDIAGTSYDAATVNMGAPWQMPSETQQIELRQYCSRQIIYQDDIITGELVTGPNGNSIFVPIANFYRDKLVDSRAGHYWSSSLSSSDNCHAVVLGFSPSYYDIQRGRDLYFYYGPLFEGRSVRAVCP